MIQYIFEVKGYFNEFEQMYCKYRVEIDSFKRDYVSEVSCFLFVYICL